MTSFPFCLLCFLCICTCTRMHAFEPGIYIPIPSNSCLYMNTSCCSLLLSSHSMAGRLLPRLMGELTPRSWMLENGNRQPLVLFLSRAFIPKTGARLRSCRLTFLTAQSSASPRQNFGAVTAGSSVSGLQPESWRSVTRREAFASR